MFQNRIYLMHRFPLRILTPLPLLCDVDWQSYGSLSGLMSILKSCEAPLFNFNFVFCDPCASIILNLVWIGAFANLNSTLTHSSAHNSVKQLRATEQLSKCAEKNALYLNSFDFQIITQVLIYLTTLKVWRYFIDAV